MGTGYAMHPPFISTASCAPPHFDLTQSTHLQTSGGEREATKYHLLLLQVFCLANNREWAMQEFLAQTSSPKPTSREKKRRGKRKKIASSKSTQILKSHSLYSIIVIRIATILFYIRQQT